ncbi:hypothetical protein C8R31_102338 [Nitrosospira sp. Nsp2]|nr:hypothetical protein C8R31_102338 [Nitrosospira sp. Nsp2]
MLYAFWEDKANLVMTTCFTRNASYGQMHNQGIVAKVGVELWRGRLAIAGTAQGISKSATVAGQEVRLLMRLLLRVPGPLIGGCAAAMRYLYQQRDGIPCQRKCGIGISARIHPGHVHAGERHAPLFRARIPCLPLR